VADIFTKPLRPLFEKHRATLLGLAKGTVVASTTFDVSTLEWTETVDYY
jgi:hypothetical protein